MSKRTTVTVRFNRFPQTALATKQAVEHLVEKATIDIAARAAANAPIDTGALAESYTYEVEGTFNGAEGIAYSDIEYAPYQEFGTVHNAPQPHVRPAVEQTKGELIALGRVMGKSIERAARGG